MGRAIAVKTAYSGAEVRRLAKRTKDAAQARRLLAVAAILDGASREEAAKTGGMDRQTLRDWVIRFNEQGPDGLINIASPGAPAKLDEEHKAFLARIVSSRARRTPITWQLSASRPRPVPAVRRSGRRTLMSILRAVSCAGGPAI